MKMYWLLQVAKGVSNPIKISSIYGPSNMYVGMFFPVTHSSTQIPRPGTLKGNRVRVTPTSLQVRTLIHIIFLYRVLRVKFDVYMLCLNQKINCVHQSHSLKKHVIIVVVFQ